MRALRSSGLAALAADTKDPEAQKAAIRELGGRGPAARAAIPAVIRALATPKDFLRNSALATLDQLGPPDASAIPALVEVLAVDDPVVRHRAAVLFGNLGPQARSAVPARRSPAQP